MKPFEDATQTRRIKRVKNGACQTCDDILVVEEPLEIRVGNRRFTATMRTPGDDFHLARGLLFSEGVISSLDDIGQMRFCDAGEIAEFGGDENDARNILQIQLRHSNVAPHLWERNIISNSSCGLCGKASIEALRARVAPLPPGGTVDSQLLESLTHKLRAAQKMFEATGGTHAAGIFDSRGEALAMFEDIGRHNATDKAIGFGLQSGFLPHSKNEPLILLVSGRASFEIVQKALVARISIVASVSAASSLAAQLAGENNQTLVAFLRGENFSILAGSERVV